MPSLQFGCQKGPGGKAAAAIRLCFSLVIVCATANSTPQVDRAMAYCLRYLPLCPQTLIDEMCQHWRYLEHLKAAGGTPSARCLKAFEFMPDRGATLVRAREHPDHIRTLRGFIRESTYRCPLCRLRGRRVGDCLPCFRGRPFVRRVGVRSFFFHDPGEEWYGRNLPRHRYRV